jgi:hypothetical protein
MAEPILFVAGLGRCGTTMVMRMLDKGGIPVAGPRPDYEDRHMAYTTPHHIRQEWVLEQAGRAVKWIDPLRSMLHWDFWKGGEVAFLLMRRDPEHQARSMGKLLGEKLSKAGVAALAESIRQDQKTTEAYLERAGNVYSMSFEWTLKEPGEVAAKLAAICKTVLGRDLDTEAAARAVIRRTPWCAPDLEIEEQLHMEHIENG